MRLTAPRDPAPCAHARGGDPPPLCRTPTRPPMTRQPKSPHAPARTTYRSILPDASVAHVARRRQRQRRRRLWRQRMPPCVTAAVTPPPTTATTATHMRGAAAMSTPPPPTARRPRVDAAPVARQNRGAPRRTGRLALCGRRRRCGRRLDGRRRGGAGHPRAGIRFRAARYVWSRPFAHLACPRVCAWLPFFFNHLPLVLRRESRSPCRRAGQRRPRVWRAQRLAAPCRRRRCATRRRRARGRPLRRGRPPPDRARAPTAGGAVDQRGPPRRPWRPVGPRRRCRTRR